MSESSGEANERFALAIKTRNRHESRKQDRIGGSRGFDHNWQILHW
jgi:hypothetical protein